jgi:hypothetical protein
MDVFGQRAEQMSLRTDQPRLGIADVSRGF